MFFSGIEKWTNKKLLLFSIIGYLVVFSLLLVAPTITVACKYQIFTNGATKLTGIGLILVVFMFVTSYSLLKKMTNKMPEIKRKQQIFKYTLQLVIDIIPFVLIKIVMMFLADDVELFYSTLSICIWYFLFYAVFENVYIKYIDAERKIRSAGQMSQAVEIRKKNGVL